MMRKLFVMAVVAGLVAAGAQNAMAGATVDLLFVGKNGAPISATNAVDAVGGDTLTMAIIMRTDVELSANGFSLNYDTDGQNQLDVVSATQWAGAKLNPPSKGVAVQLYSPIGPLDPTTPTFVGSFNSTNNLNSLGLFLPARPSGYQIGTVTWHVNAPTGNNQSSIVVGFLNAGVDGLGGAGFTNIADTAAFNGATVNVIPEPGTAGLLGLGIVGLVLAGRRSRRA